MSEVNEALNDESPSHPMPIISSSAAITHKRKQSIAEEEDEVAASRNIIRTHKRIKQSSLPPAAFWDNLSKVPLTRRAIRELDRRTKQSISFSSALSCEYPAQLQNAAERFARRGGPDLSDLRGYTEPTANPESCVNMNRRQSSKNVPGKSSSGITKSSSEPKSKKSSAYDAAFQQYLIDHGVYPEGYELLNDAKSEEHEPSNLPEIRQRMGRHRRSLSPSTFDSAAFRDFKKKERDAKLENDVMRSVLPVICGESPIPHQENVQFSRLLTLTGGTTVNPQPDFYDGAKPERIHKRVRTDLDLYITPSNRTDLPAAPNFFLEAKGPSGAHDVLERQACLNGAAGARAMLKLQSYGQTAFVPDGKAYAISSTYGSGVLKLYTTHPAPPATPEQDFDYHMTTLGAWAINGSDTSFREGAKALRNAREWAQDERDRLILSANEVAKRMDKT